MSKVKTKAVNYTEEQIVEMKSLYTGADNTAEVATIAAKLGKTSPSVRSKLASLGLYKATEKAETAGEDRVTKTVLTDAIGEIVGLAEHEREGLAKATKSALEKVLAKLA